MDLLFFVRPRDVLPNENFHFIYYAYITIFVHHIHNYFNDLIVPCLFRAHLAVFTIRFIIHHPISCFDGHRWKISRNKIVNLYEKKPHCHTETYLLSCYTDRFIVEVPMLSGICAELVEIRCRIWRSSNFVISRYIYVYKLIKTCINHQLGIQYQHSPQGFGIPLV